MKKSWKDNNMIRSLREDYAQDRKELDYLEIERDKKQLGFERALADTKDKINEDFKKLCDTLDSLFNPFGFYIKDGKNYWRSENNKVLCFRNKDDNEEYELKYFSKDVLYYSGYEGFRSAFLGAVIGRVMDGLHGKDDKYYPLEAEDFASYKEGLSKLEKLADDFQKQILPIFKDAANRIKMELKISSSNIPRNANVYDARVRARKSYIKENPIAPGMVVIWHLQNGEDRDVEVVSVDDSNQTATIKTDGGAVRKVPLKRLEVDTVRAGID